MRPFTKQEGPDATCPKCRAVYEVEYGRDPIKDRSFKACDDCGEVLFDDYDTYTTTYQFKEHGPNWKPKQDS